MNDPYDVLGIDRSADEPEIRQRYLQLVRQFPPERNPERFTEVRAAYEQVRDPVERLKLQLFDMESPDSLNAILADVRSRLRNARIPTDSLLKLADQP